MKHYSIALPCYPYRMQVSKNQRPIYYVIENRLIKPTNKVRKSMINDMDLYFTDKGLAFDNIKYPYAYGLFKNNKLQGYFLPSDSYIIIRLYRDFKLDIRVINTETLEPLLANPKRAGTAKYVYINGQVLYSQQGGGFIRQKMMEVVKSFISEHCKNIPVILNYPITIHYELFDTIKSFHDNTKEGNGRRWDVYNRISPYMKAFPDFLVKGDENTPPKLIDDDRLHLIGESYHFTPIGNHENRQILITISYEG